MVKTYQENESYFVSDGITYDLNYIFKNISYPRTPLFISISELEWILEFDKGDDDKIVEEKRIAQADINIPILITSYKNKWLVIDGVHRLRKAIKEGKQEIAYREVSKSLLEKSRVNVAKENLNNKIKPKFFNW